MKVMLVGSSVVQGLLYHHTVLGKQLKSNGHDVYVILNRLPEQFPGLMDELVNSGIKIIFCDDLLYTGFKAIFRSNSGIKKALKEVKPDIVQTFGAISAFQFFTFRKKYKIITMIAATGHKYISWKKKVATFVGAQMLNIVADKVFTLCKQEEERFLNAGLLKKKCAIVHNWVDIDRFRSYREPNIVSELLTQYGIPKDKRIVSCFANFQYRKRQDIVIKTLAKHKNNDVHLVLAGIGDTEDYLKEIARELKVEKQISFLPRIPIPEVVQLMNYSDLVVHLSNAETFGYSIIEPLILGKNLIVAEVGIGYELNEMDLAYVIPYDDDQTYAMLYERFLKHDLPMKSTEEAMLKFVRDNFDREVVVSRMEYLYNN